MSCESEVIKIGEKLDKIMAGSKEEEEAHALLEALGKLPITLAMLKSTQIGKKINNFRKKIDNERMSKQAKKLIKKWKNLVDEKEDGDSDKSKEKKIKQSDSVASNLSQKSTESAGSSRASPSQSMSMSSASNGFPPKSITGDEIRCKSAQMILDALRKGDLPDGTLDPEDLAVKIEAEMYKVHNGTTEKYKSALRSRVFNLRDKKNVALRENVLTGVVKPERFAVMTSEEMASDDIRKMREKFNKESILEHQMSVQQGTPSDMFKCGKCGKKNCTYNQLQTRSSDEPMTTFVYCLECGNRWKFC